MDLKNKHILLLMPSFYEYHKILINELESRGAKVDFIDNVQLKFNPSSPVCKFRWLRKFIYRLFSINWFYLKKRLKKDISYDYFICINGFTFDKRLISFLKSKNKNIKTILYLWDSTNMYYWDKIESYFDKAYTFDPLDSKNLNIEFLPNFYTFLDKENLTKDIDFFFVGTNHGDRFDFFSKLCNKLVNYNTFIKLVISYKKSIHNKYLYCFLKKKIFKRYTFVNEYIQDYELFEGIIVSNFLVYEKINYKVIYEKMKRSKCIIDIESSKQKGLTHQFMAALALNKNIITTNKYILNTVFYDSKKIFVIDRVNPIVLDSFLENFDLEHSNKEEIQKYKIDNWLNIILSHEN